ncbi:MAG: FAD binding domain-containing protein [Saprospiraceae bacterium]|jgi:xanthine dehydrogenase small subunit|nr:FAD binding domain-containing protein [Saprospiraceae bacterium]
MNIRFILNDKMVVTASNSALTLLDFIRYEAQLKGTKIGCREGDCGACTVLSGTLIDEKVHYKIITSCLTPLANVHGKHIVTIEGLNISGVNKVQDALVENSGTQCGFCTPGFVVSLSGFALNEKNHDQSSAISSIDGNICRCTGYKSIERAAQTIVKNLTIVDNTNRLEWLIKNKFIPEYFESIPSQLEKIEPLSSFAGNVAIAGGTDLYVRSHDELSDMKLNFLSGHSTPNVISVHDGGCKLKATTTVSELMENTEISDVIPRWYQYMKLVSSTPIRNIATVGGNLINASPIGDITIVLLALNSKITLSDTAKNQRAIQLDNFYKGYKILDKTSDEIITEVSFQLPGIHTKFNFEKVCKRMYLDIASVNTAITVQNKDQEIVQLRCSIGGVGPIPLFLASTSNFLVGKKISAANLIGAELILQSEISPISDARGHKEYKRLLARQLFFSHFITLFPQ